MSEMVERVARAICNNNPDCAGGCTDLARAAIAAMREPTGGMFIAGVACMASFADHPDQDMSFPILWDHVIDEALK